MIKVKNGKTTLKGAPWELASELALAVRAFVRANVENGIPREEAVDLTRKSLELAFKTDEEIHAEAQKKVGELLTRLGSAMASDTKEEEVNE